MKAQEVIFKGTKRGLHLILNADENIDDLVAVLRRKLSESKNFYSGASVTVETRGAVVPPEWIEEVRAILGEYGLSVSEKARVTAKAPSREQTPPKEVPASASGGPAGERGDTILIWRTLRAGQVVSFDGNVVIMGDVNPGSEVTASGDIVVFGSLRGLAHAGATGSESAKVVAVRLTPTQLRIADKITRSPDEAQVPDGPEAAFLRDGAIVIEPWTSQLGTVLGV